MEQKKNDRLWTASFAILWQGQLISTVGDAVYSIALGFWILAVTGSTTLMGTLMAVSTLPGIVIAPFAGVIIDNVNKKKLFVFLDILRGICIVLISVAAYQNLLSIWMVFVAGVILSLCGAIFNPGVQSAIPDIVPKSKISNALSVFSILTSGSNMAGNIAGGFLFQALGAPVLFLFNGISFLISGISITFTKIPYTRKKQKLEFLKDMSDGFKYMWNQKGLRVILLLAAMCNFFSYIAIVLLLPYCKYNSNLGAGKYGIIMSSFMGGAMVGFLIMSVATLKPHNKFKIFITASILYNICMIIAFNQPYFIVMTLLIIVAGLFNSIFNVILISTIQASANNEVRGKVMSFLNMITQGLTPFAMALGGILGDILPIRFVITGAFLAVSIFSVPAYFSKSFREFITSDYISDSANK